MAGVRKFLVEFDTYDDAEAGIVREYFATGAGYITRSAHTPSNTVYLPLLLDAGSVEEFLFDDGKTTGMSVPSAGSITLNNASRRLDYLLNRGLDGRELLIKELTSDSKNPADSPVRFRAVIQSIDFSNRTIRINIRSPFFAVMTDTYQPFKYAGTNDGSSVYLEGTGDDIGGSPKPRILGKGAAGNMPALLVDRANEIYQLSSDPVAEVPTMYVGRASITAGTAHATLSSFVTAATDGSVTAGQFDYYLGSYVFDEGDNERGCFVAFGTTPDKTVTFDAIEGWKNLFTYSTDLTNVAWTTNSVTVVSAGAGSAPDDIQTAYTVTKTATGGANLRQDVTTVSGRYYTVSAFLEADTLETLVIRATGTGVRAEVEFDTSDGTTSTVTNNVTSTSLLNPTMSALGGGRYRCSLTFDANNTSTQLRFYPQNSSATTAGSITLFGLMLEEGVYAVGPYNATTSAVAYNHSAACTMWKILNSAGYDLCPLCVITANAEDNAEVFRFQDNTEAQIGRVIPEILESSKLFLRNTAAGVYRVGRFKAPTIGELVREFDNRVLIDGSSDARIKILSPSDIGNGIPIYRANIRYQKNYTVMGEADVYGIAGDAANLGDIPFVSQEWRTETDTDTGTQTKHLNSLERTVDTALADAADASTRAAYELTLYDTQRLTVEIEVPVVYGFALSLGDVIQVENRIYRITGRRLRFASESGGGADASLVVLQAWGGVEV